MMIMPNQNCSGIVHYFAGKYPGKIGFLLSPDGWRIPPYYMPYALDNGAFNGFEPMAYRKMLFEASRRHKPIWALVPDVVGQAEATFRKWDEWKDEVVSYDYPLAFACQDGMNPGDVPEEAVCCFIGGTTDWKLENAHRFKGVRPLLHIGRVNTGKRLRWAEMIGADSVDGSGWFRGSKDQIVDFIMHFEGNPQKEFFI